MYEKFYGFSEKPFQIVPNPNFLYLTSKHQNALTYLEYGLTEGVGFILLTGEIGTGKTTLIRHILNQIETDLEVAVIFNTNVTEDQLLNLILQEFELTPVANDKTKNLDILYRFLIKKYARGKRTLLIIDEAQNLSNAVLEEVRMLSNLQSDEQALLQIMLVGQPELKKKLKTPSLAQLSQRIAVNYHLTALNREDTRSYIISRLQKAGGKSDVFTIEAMDMIYQSSGGVPRSINIICDSALVYGFADELKNINANVIEQVLEDKGGMGLELDTASKEMAVTGEFGDEEYGASHQLRFKSLEDNVRKLQLQMDWQLEELERRAVGFQEELVNKLNQLVEKERRHSVKLLRENTLLRERIKTLQSAQEENSKPSFTIAPENGESTEKVKVPQNPLIRPASKRAIRSWFKF